MKAGADPGFFAGGFAQGVIFLQKFLYDFPFHFYNLDAASHHVLFQNKFLYFGCLFA